jgi:sec-independent protein translocase protein TatA
MFSGLENPTHILMLLLLVALFFGAKRLPEVGRSLGTGMREFRDSVTGRVPDVLNGETASLPDASTSQASEVGTANAESS